MQVRVPISVGELLDKISILRIKERRISDATKQGNVRRELAALEQVTESLGLPADRRADWLSRLDRVNEVLWEVEDRIRACESRSDFGQEFVELARSVYRTNDERARIKREINQASGSDLVEEKSYVDPDGESPDSV